MFSLNTWGEFDDLCELNNLKKKLFARSDFPCPTNMIFHIISNYNYKGVYLVHRVYIYLNLKIPLFHNETCCVEDHNSANISFSSSSICANELQVCSQEGECCGQPNTTICSRCANFHNSVILSC